MNIKKLGIGGRYFKIAGFVINISFEKTPWGYLKNELKQKIINYLSQFSLQKKPTETDFYIKITEASVSDMTLYSHKKDNYIKLFSQESNKKINCHYQISLAEFQIILRYILHHSLVDKNSILLHCSAIRHKKQALIFLGPSGAGKTTIANFLQKNYPTLTDDTGIVHIKRQRCYFYQSPFYEKNWRFSRSPDALIVKKAFFLKKSRHNKVIEINDRSILFKKLRPLLLVGKKNEKKDHRLLKKMIKNCRFYNLAFTKDEEKIKKLIKII